MSVYKPISCLGCGWELVKAGLIPLSLGLAASGVSRWVPWPLLPLLQGLSSKDPACLPATCPEGPGPLTPVEVVLGSGSLESLMLHQCAPCHSGVEAAPH